MKQHLPVIKDVYRRLTIDDGIFNTSVWVQDSYPYENVTKELMWINDYNPVKWSFSNETKTWEELVALDKENEIIVLSL